LVRSIVNSERGQAPRSTVGQRTAQAADTGVGQGTFKDFRLLPEVERAIVEMGFEEPTPVQAATYGPIMGGGDLIVMAQTGTGKTAAFGIPMAQNLDTSGGLQAMVLTPTRELALQVAREIASIGKRRGITAAAVYGGASFTKQVEEVSDGAQVVVGTPGRVMDHMRRKTIPFGGIKMLVLDEADEMLSMGFEKELSEIMGGLPTKRQTLLFSATIPDDIQRLSSRYMTEATTLSVSGDAVAAKETSHYVYLLSGAGRTTDLLKVLEIERPESAIVLCHTKDETHTAARFLQAAGYHADWINYDLSQAERERVMSATRSGKVKFMVATDVAARGIDISHLSHVINFTFPESLEIYVHRTGRTGRQGRHGAAISLISPHDIGNLYFMRLTYKIFPVERTLPGEENLIRKLELERLDSLRAAFAGVGAEGFRGLARRLFQDIQGERLVASLLERHFADAPPAKPAEVKPQAQPVPEPQAEPVPEAPEPAAIEPPSEIEAPDEAPQDEDDRPTLFPESFSGGDSREIFLDAGRKDGLRISTLMKQIVENTGLARNAVGRVRMLTRSTFVAVAAEHYDAVLEALSGIELDGRRLKAEPAGES